jgi:hypothetical protein
MLILGTRKRRHYVDKLNALNAAAVPCAPPIVMDAGSEPRASSTAEEGQSGLPIRPDRKSNRFEYFRELESRFESLE